MGERVIVGYTGSLRDRKEKKSLTAAKCRPVYTGVWVSANSRATVREMQAVGSSYRQPRKEIGSSAGRSWSSSPLSVT